MGKEYKEEVGRWESFNKNGRLRVLKNLKTEEKIEKPSKIQMAKNFTRSIAKTAKAITRGEEIVAKSELYSKRTSICRSCPWFSGKGERCQKCGCIVPLKAYFNKEKCPIGKW